MGAGTSWIVRVAVLGLGVAVGVGVGVAGADAPRVDHEARKQSHVLPPVAVPPPAVEPEPFAEAPLWELHRRGRHGELRREIRRRQSVDPGWSPPPVLDRALRDAAFEWTIRRAIAERRDERLVAIAESSPRSFGCARIDRLWGLAEARARLDQTTEARALFERAVTTCTRLGDRLTTIRKARESLGLDVAEALHGRLRDARSRPEAIELATELATARLAADLDAGRDAAVRARGRELAPEIERRRDAATARALGWAHLRGDEPAVALDWFERARRWDPSQDDATYGAALAARASGDPVRSEALARTQTSPRFRALVAELELERIREWRREGRVDEALEALAERERRLGLDRGSGELRAWTLLDLDRSEEAAEAFEQLYRDEPAPALADGLLASLEQAGRYDRVEALADELDGPFVERASEQHRRRLVAGKRFRAAATLSRSTDGPLANADAPIAGLSGGLRRKSGRAGLDRLRLEKLPTVHGATGDGRLGVWARVARVRLDAGRPSLDAPLGSVSAMPASPAGPPLSRPTTTEVEGVETLVGLAWVDDGVDAVETRLELGTTPTGGPVGVVPIGRLRMERATGPRRWHAELFGEPVRESLLAAVGVRDPHGPGAWGRVIRSGLRLGGGLDPAPSWRAGASVAGEILAGDGVARNEAVRAQLGARRSWMPPGFDEIALGPELHLEHYEENLSRFTRGHGGYFSPERLVEGLAVLDLRTREGEPFVLELGLAAGAHHHRQAATRSFPLRGTGPRHAASEENGASLSAEGHGAWLFAPRWQLAAGFAVRRAPSYDEVAGYLALQLFFEERRATFSTDLPRFLLGDLR